MLKTIVLFLFLGFLYTTNGQTNLLKSGPVGPITIYQVTHCDPDINSVGFESKMNLDSEPSLSLKFNLPFDITDDTYIVLILDKWEMSTWKEEFYKTEGTFFDNINKYIKTVFADINTVFDPPIEGEDIIPAGEYKVENFKESYTNVDLPQIFYGRFKVRITMSDDEHDDFLCVMSEFESHEP